MDQKKRSFLLTRLWETQQDKGYIGDDDVVSVAEEFGISRIETEGVIGFYHFLRREPSGKFIIYLNNSILSHLEGFGQIRKVLEEETGAVMGSVDPSGSFGLYETSCIGMSDREPAALINFYPFTRLTPEKIRETIRALKAGCAAESLADEIDEQVHHVLPEERRILLKDFTPGRAIDRMKGRTPEEIIALIRDSGLTGRGGAFFRTGMKWELCRQAEGQPKFIVCNADEGEPGSFKDRALMQLYPGLMIEGMIIAGYAAGADEGIIYLRAEYNWLVQSLEKTLQWYRQNGLLGAPVDFLNDFRFEIRIQMGAGAYVCGEETALLESLEGKRGEPRVKTFFPTDRGFLGKPTVINNVETLCTAARIVESGADKFLSCGTSGSKGTKLLSISGDCKRPGVYEIEWGMGVSELLEKCGAEDPAFIQMSGPSGELVSIKEKDRTISCEDIRCEGSVMIFNSSRNLLTILENYARFFTHESCGICTPCRAGNPLLLKMTEKLIAGQATEKDLAAIEQWSGIIRNNSRCGLGASSPNALMHALKKFPEIIRAGLLKESLFRAEFDLGKATEAYNRLTNGEQQENR